MSVNITDSGEQTIAAAADGIEVVVNSFLTTDDTITITTAGSDLYDTGGTTVGTITGPTAGQGYKFTGLRTQGAIVVNPSTACDITVNFLSPGA